VPVAACAVRSEVTLSIHRQWRPALFSKHEVMNAKLSIENINPKRASEMLANIFEGQRNLRNSYVDRLAQEIINGQWRLSPDCIVIIKDCVANGQHRLQAVVRAGKACPFIVMTSADDELFKIIDCGIKRTVADALTNVNNATSVASAATWIMKYDLDLLGRTHGGGQSNTCTRSSILEYVQQHHDELQEQVVFCAALYKKKQVAVPSRMAALLHIGARKNDQMTRRFITSVYMGDSREDSAWDFREKIMRDRAGKAKLPAPFLFGLAIKSLRSYINGTRIGVLKYVSTEEFPKL
jgi:hypothetical protein